MGRWFRSALVAVVAFGVGVTGCASKNTPVVAPVAPERKVTAAVSRLATIERRGELRVLFDIMNPSIIATGTMQPEEAFGADVAHRIAEIVFDGKVKVKWLPSLQRPEALKAGAADLLLDTAWQPAGEELKTFYMSLPYYTDSARLLVRTDGGVAKREDLNGKAVGQLVDVQTTDPERFPGYLRKTRPQLDIKWKEYKHMGLAVDDLKKGKITAVIGATTELARYAKEDSLMKLLPARYETWTHSVIVLKQNGELTAAVDKAIRQMTESGELNQLVKKWGLDI